MQESYFREIRRVTNLLLKIKRYERKMEGSQEAAVGNDPAASGFEISSEYVDDNKGS
jgi:hypothetical protein